MTKTKAKTAGAARRRTKRKAPTMPSLPDGLMPTPETLGKDAFEVIRLEKNGPKIVKRAAENMLDRLLRLGSLTKQQAEAGHRYEEDHAKVWGTMGSRDSTIPPVGGIIHETTSQAERIVRAKGRMNAVLNACGPSSYTTLRAVAVYGEPIGEDRGARAAVYEKLRAALDAAAVVYGVPGYKDGE